PRTPTLPTPRAGSRPKPPNGALSDIPSRFGAIHEDLTTDVTRPKFEAFVRALLAPLYRELGITPAASDGRGAGARGAERRGIGAPGVEDDNRRELRAVVVA